MYQGTLTDRDKGETIKFRDKSIFEVMTHFSMLIEDCDLEKVQIKIVRKPKLKEQQYKLLSLYCVYKFCEFIHRVNIQKSNSKSINLTLKNH